MKKFILIALTSFALSGCASFGTFTNPLTPSRIDALNASWGAALSLADGYYETCERRLIAPSCRTVVAKMQRAAAPIHAKVKQARLFAKNPTISQVDLIVLASDAVNDFKVLQLELGVK